MSSSVSLIFIGHPEWLTDDRFVSPYRFVATARGGHPPCRREWAAGRSRLEVCEALSGAGIAAGPCVRAEELVGDAHVNARHMLVGINRTGRCRPTGAGAGQPGGDRGPLRGR